MSLVDTPTPKPEPDEVVVRVDAAPINPSDLGLLFGAADMSTAKASGTPSDPVVNATVPPKLMRAMAGWLNQSLPVGNEGAGVVIDTGSSEEAKKLLGKTVAVMDGAMYSQYKVVKASQCLMLLAGTTAEEGASCFVNPLSVLAMVETMKLEGHKALVFSQFTSLLALVHTAAASNLGQMLIRLCNKDGIGLVNIVRKQEQVELLKSMGAEYVCNSSAPTFRDDLTEALAATEATLAFDAIGGGTLAGQILTCMEVAANQSAKEYNRYGSSTHKQVYIYGALGRGPTELNRNFGMAWSIGGWLMPPFLDKIGTEAAEKLRERVAAEIKTTFASKYTKKVSLAGALSLPAIAAYGKQATGEKFLITPNEGLL